MGEGLRARARLIGELIKRLPRLAANITLAFGFYMITFLVSSLFTAFNPVLPIVNVSISELVRLVLFAAIALSGVMIVADLMWLIDVGSSLLITRLPGMKGEGEASIRRALKDVVYIIVVILIVWPILPISSEALSGVPLFGGYVSSAASFIVLGVVLFLLYDVSRTIHSIVSTRAAGIADLITSRIAKKLREEKPN
ncbi:TPA: hypothetical protein EYP44_05765 [Candidatus Bathyarchaeota archaeon]|nr:hypothetical protein [Candidatus Bathyarchaeota archaeon]